METGDSPAVANFPSIILLFGAADSVEEDATDSVEEDASQILVDVSSAEIFAERI
mgnify:CR=1 FL=1